MMPRDAPPASKRLTVHCQCGVITGTACAWTGDIRDTVVVEVMPECFRASHRNAGHCGQYPQNGAVRLRVERDCAELLLETEEEWAALIEESA